MKWFWTAISVLWLIAFVVEWAAGGDSDHPAVMMFLSIAISYLCDIREGQCR
ncbi:hypothetical protein [Eggerthella lenta]|uniref:hypothetical protein n=1 Tax=Eggerthella lenta TaxID=84112 RepID=UPI0022E4EB5A|nr:hypothetical protein [Eggerthella lenta]